MTKEEFNQLLKSSKDDSIIFISIYSEEHHSRYVICAIPFFCMKEGNDLTINTSAQIILNGLNDTYGLRNLEITIKHKKHSLNSKKEEGEALTAYLSKIK